MITSKFLSIHTDINSAGNSLPLWLKPSHPNWIGAWWLPFLAFGFTSLIMAVVIFLFPRKIVHEGEQQQQQQQNGKEIELTNLMNGAHKSAENGVENGINKNYEQQSALMEATRDIGSMLSLNHKATANGNFLSFGD